MARAALALSGGVHDALQSWTAAGSSHALLELLVHVLLQSSDWFLQEKVLVWTPVYTLL